MRFTDCLAGQTLSPPPIWIMRQAGRYLAEYRAIRATTPDFISFCLSPDKACEVTLQPIRRFGFDAAIVFSDILLVPWALDRNVHFIAGDGPKLTPLLAPDTLCDTLLDGLEEKLAPIANTIKKARAALPKETALIGFSGSPWTLITYMAEGGSSRDFTIPRSWLWSQKAGMEKLTAQLVEAISRFLALQATAGADVLMLFDSWASAVPADYRREFISAPTQAIISNLRARGINQPIICFPKQIGETLIPFAHEVDCQCVAIDHNTDIEWAAKTLPPNMALQGNLDPLALISSGDEMRRGVEKILNACRTRPHIFNLGHGITPPTPTQHVEELLALVRGQ